MRTIRSRLAALAAALLAVATIDAAHTYEASAASPPPGCGDFADPIELTSIDQVSELLQGTWISCADDGQALGISAPGEVGFQVAGDRFNRVYRSDDGSLISAEGAGDEGVVAILDLSAVNGPGSFQINIEVLGSGTVINGPEFFAAPAALRLSSMMTTEDFVRWDGAPPTPGVRPGAGDEPCAVLRDPVELTSAAQVTDLLTGTWIRCAATEPGPFVPGEVGFMVDGGRYYRVYEAAAGELIRAGGADQEGVVTVTGEAPSFQIGITMMASGSSGGFPTFFATPDSLRMNTMEGVFTYLRWTGSPPAPGDPPGAAGDPCGVLRDPVELTSTAQASELLTGTWILCGGEPILAPLGTNEVGIEIADGLVRRVSRGSDGALVLAVGDDWQAQVRVDSMGTYYVDFVRAESSTGGPLTFFASPDAMRVTGMNGAADYLRWTGSAPAPTTTTTTEPSQAPAIPATGTDAAVRIVAGAVVVVLGIALVVAARRPRHARPRVEHA